MEALKINGVEKQFPAGIPQTLTSPQAGNIVQLENRFEINTQNRIIF